MEKKINVEFTKEEAKALLIQIGYRVDELVDIQEKEGKNGNIQRVIELEEFLKPIRSGKEKIEKIFYNM